jgi:hypothetical protein
MSSQMETVISKDGTRIAYDRTGRGEPVILVAGAFSYRKLTPKVIAATLTEFSATDQRKGAHQFGN